MLLLVRLLRCAEDEQQQQGKRDELVRLADGDHVEAGSKVKCARCVSVRTVSRSRSRSTRANMQLTPPKARSQLFCSLLLQTHTHIERRLKFPCFVARAPTTTTTAAAATRSAVRQQVAN